MQADQFSTKAQTVNDNILKEHYQMYILDVLFKSPLEKNIVFKGGTALRLSYGSFRFSEDLDFSLLHNVPYTTFKETIEKLPTVIPEAEVKDVHDKYHTLYAKMIIHVGFKPIPIGIKIEINKHTKEFAHTVRLMKSPFNNIEVLGKVYTLEAILHDKLHILESSARREPRDVFDAWYICQKINKDFVVKNSYKYTRKELLDKLNPFLPIHNRNILSEFTV